MSKKRRPDNRIERQPDARTVDPVQPVAVAVNTNADDATEKVDLVSGRYVPPEHSECESMRPPGRWGKVYKTTTINTQTEMIVTHYCFCRWCSGQDEFSGAKTYKHVEVIKHDTTSVV